MQTYERPADTAKKVRIAIKNAFAGTAFGVTTKHGSIYVRWEDGPRQDAVSRVASKFAGAHFDGMTDMKTVTGYTDESGASFFGVDYIFCERSLSAEREAELNAFAAANLNAPGWSDWQKQKWAEDQLYPE